MDKIYSPFCSSSISINPSEDLTITTSTAWMANLFEQKELLSALRAVKSHSSPGMDAVNYRIKELPDSLLETLLAIINRLFDSASFPQS